MTKALPSAPSTSNTAKYIGMLVGGIVIGVLLAWGYSSLHGSPSTVATTNVNATSTSGTKSTTTKPNTALAADVSLASSGSDTLNVPQSQNAGMSVTVTKAVVSKPTWVVVYDNVGGKPGNALGAQMFFKTQGGTIALLRPTIAGKTYFVGERIDNGDHVYSKSSDSAVGDTVSFTAI